MLIGREGEQALLRRLLADGRAGRGRALLVQGEAGIGKSALLAFCVEQAATARVITGAGREAEEHLPFAGLHLLMRPVADHMDALTPVQQTVMRNVFEAGSQGPEDRFRVAVAVQTLLAAVAARGHLVMLVDNVQWLDRCSAEVLLFAARRLAGTGVTMVFAGRDGRADFQSPDVQELTLRQLDSEASAELLTEHHPDRAAPVREGVLWEAEGNPLALLELPEAFAARERAGAFSPPIGPVGAPRLPQKVRDTLQTQVAALPGATRRLLLLMAIDDRGDLGVLVRAGQRLGVSIGDLESAEHGGLVGVRDRSVVFRHPLLRAAVRAASSLPQRLAAHDALAAAYEGEQDVDRQAWHLA